MSIERIGDAPRFEDWRTVGCGVESLHHLLVRSGVEVSIDDVLRRTLAHDGYDEELGWRHHALVRSAGEFGITGEVRGSLTAEDLLDGLWIVSVTAPEQFTSTHLVAVRRDGPPRADETAAQTPIRIYWPQGQLDHGEVFTVPLAWISPRLTGRGMRFARPVE